MDFLAFVMTGFWPVIARTSSAAVSRTFELAMASPMPILMTILSRRGTAIGFLISNSFEIAGAISFVYRSFNLAAIFFPRRLGLAFRRFQISDRAFPDSLPLILFL